LHVEVASQFGIGSDRFRFVADFLGFINAVGECNGFASSVIAEEGGHNESLRPCRPNTKLRRSCYLT
jgi:hypothetical protein